MAIIPNVPNVIVDIVVDGKPLPEYLDEDDDESVTSNSTTKYVECVSGSNFGIRTNVAGLDHRHLGGGNALLVEYYLDGQRVDSGVLRYPWKPGHAVYEHRAARHREGTVWKERELMFTNLVTSMLLASQSIQIIANDVFS